MSRRPTRIMIVGPTASGKSGLAHRLALRVDGEVISVDSRQCYRRIDIGTAKPGHRLLAEVLHHNISVLDPEQTDSVASFLNRAERWREEIESRGRMVIYAGGSTLHLQALIRPLDDELPRSDPANLSLLEKRAESEGLESLFGELSRVDPVSADRMDGLNRHRIFRALDVWMQTKKPFSSFHHTYSTPPAPPPDLIVFGLHWPRKQLHERINRRVHQMIDQGLVAETHRLLEEGYSPDLQSLQTVGYRSVIRHLNGELTQEEMTEEMKTASRRYAKRQITWFRRWTFIHWMDASETSREERVDRIVQEISKRSESASGTPNPTFDR